MSSYESEYGRYLRELLGIPGLQESIASVAKDVTSIKRQVAALAQKEGILMTSVDDLRSEEADLKTALDNATAREQSLITGLQSQIKDLQDKVQQQAPDLSSDVANLASFVTEADALAQSGQAPPATGP